MYLIVTHIPEPHSSFTSVYRFAFRSFLFTCCGTPSAARIYLVAGPLLGRMEGIPHQQLTRRDVGILRPLQELDVGESTVSDIVIIILGWDRESVSNRTETDGHWHVNSIYPDQGFYT